MPIGRACFQQVGTNKNILYCPYRTIKKNNTIKAKAKTYNFRDAVDFEGLYRKFWKKLYIICHSKTKDREASEEMVQDIFISLWRRKDELEMISSMEHYLVKSAKLKVIDYYRKQYSNKQSVECNLCDHSEFDNKCLEHNEALFNFLEHDIELIVNQLPCQCQKVYRLSREAQMNTSEIASNLDISQKTVKNHLTKALRSIRIKMIKDLSP